MKDLGTREISDAGRLTAKEARDFSAKSVQINEFVRTALREVFRAAIRGKTKYTFYTQTLSDEERKTFETLGYSIEKYNDEVTISW